MEEITLASAVFEKDYKVILNNLYSKKHFADNNKLFAARMLIINNVNNSDCIEHMLREISVKPIDVYYSKEVEQEIFPSWGITRESFYRIDKNPINMLRYVKNKRRLPYGLCKYDGYWYSIAPMTAIMKCKTKWLLYITGDASLENYQWVDKAQELMSRDKSILAANPLWIEHFSHLTYKGGGEEWVWGDNFSDQCFLVNVNQIRNIKGLLNEKNEKTEQEYPYYGGNCFERRVGAYMRNHNLKRIINTKEFYSCRDF
ncbi:MAG: hypothetical protein NC313_07325 [Butyrivibrio sp.]|nr:hypothetical protein [Butyrivibrio sp.]